MTGQDPGGVLLQRLLFGVSTTDPAMSTVLGTSIEPDSRDSPSETVHRSGRSSRNSSANRNSFQAIMKT